MKSDCDEKLRCARQWPLEIKQQQQKKNALPKSSNHTVMLSIFLTIGYVNFYGHFEQNLDVDYTRESENSLELYMTKNSRNIKFTRD